MAATSPSVAGLQLTTAQIFAKVAEICAIVNSVQDEKVLLGQSLEQTLALFGAKRGSIFILKEGREGEELVLQAAIGMAMKDQEVLVKRMGEGVVGRVAASKEPIVVEDIGRDERFKGYKVGASYKTASFICAPLLVKDELIGVINITDKGCGSRFSHEELQLLDFLATQIALNFQRAKLYQGFEKVLKETQNLRDELGRSSRETDLLKKQVQLQERLASIGKLAGGIAHEFNNPLDGVMRYTNLCLEQIGEDEVARSYLLEIKRGLNRMAGIVKNLLACSRGVVPTAQKVDVNWAVEQAIDLLQPEILAKDIKIEKEFARDLSPILDLGVERIIANLVRNAIDAIEEEGRIFIRTRAGSGNIVIEVCDTGCGIEAEQIDQIFEPFFSTKDIGRGCGLGLTIVGEIVKGYNGEIKVSSKPRSGTTFTVTIPV